MALTAKVFVVSDVKTSGILNLTDSSALHDPGVTYEKIICFAHEPIAHTFKHNEFQNGHGNKVTTQSLLLLHKTGQALI